MFDLKRTIAVLVIFAAAQSTALARETVDQRTLAIATVHPLATDAAVEVFREGGNAVDAAVTAALTLGVVDSHNSGLGGGCLILVRRPDGEVLAIDGREMAPAAASRNMFLKDGVPDTSLSQTGPLAVGVPGALAAYADLAAECGELPLARLLAPGERAASEGFPLSEGMAGAIALKQETLAEFPAAREALLLADGSAPAAGSQLKQPDLARTYRKIATHGPAWFYEGEFAKKLGEWMATHGGLITPDDLANYEIKRREPIRSTYRGREIIGFPPPSSGGVHVAQALNILEPFDVGSTFAHDRIQGIHLVAEAMKLAFADRAYWLGDSDYVDVPKKLAAKSYAQQLSQKISLDQATEVPSHGTPPQWRQDLFGRHTTHIAAADSEGNWVAITATINTSFGSKVMVPGTGLILNNEMDDFAIHPGEPNAFGLVGAENNSVAPGKRPLSCMSPTIVLDDGGAPIMTLGAAGGPKIITQVIKMLLDVIDRGMTLDESSREMRYHHQWQPDEVGVEYGTPKKVRTALRAKGHKVKFLSAAARVQAIRFDPTTGFTTVFDPRIEGKAVVVESQPEPATAQ